MYFQTIAQRYLQKSMFLDKSSCFISKARMGHYQNEQSDNKKKLLKVKGKIVHVIAGIYAQEPNRRDKT